MSPSSSLQEQWRTRRRRQGMVSSDPMNKTKELRNFESAKRNKKNRRIRDISRRIKKIRNEEVRFGILPVECQFQPRRCLRYTRYTVYTFTSTPLRSSSTAFWIWLIWLMWLCDRLIHCIHTLHTHSSSHGCFGYFGCLLERFFESNTQLEWNGAWNVLSCLCTSPDTLQSPYITVAQTRSLRLKVPAFRNGTFENSHLRVNHCQLVEGSLEVKLPTIWTDEKQSRAEAERRKRLEARRVEEKEQEERRWRCAKR